MPAMLSEEEQQAASIWSEKHRSVFEIISEKGFGSGFMWDEEGSVVTNLHIIQNASNIKVKCFDGKIYDAILVGCWADKDVALLSVKELRGKVKPLSIDVYADLFVGQKVFAIGNPYRLPHSLSAGLISGLNREDKSASSGQPMRDLIQSTVDINVGSSGGPLFDGAGRVIGITTSICSRSGESSGVGFSISMRSVYFLIRFLVSWTSIIQPLQISISSVTLLPDELDQESNWPLANVVRRNALEAPIFQEFDQNEFRRHNLRGPLRENISEVIGRPMRDLTQAVSANNFGNSGGPPFGRAGQGLQKTKLHDLGFVIKSACGKIVAKADGLHSYLHLCEAGHTVTVTVEELCGGNKKKISVTLDVSKSNVMLDPRTTKSVHIR